MNLSPIIPIILCGGSGSRLWPLSRKSFPKQFLSLNSDNEKSLLQETQERIKNLKNCQNPILICNEEHRFVVAEQMREINVKPQSILLEPFGRNTAPAIAVAALKSLQLESDPILLVLSSDHQIQNKLNFIETIEKGLDYVYKNKLVTFGIIPNHPNTGYGYIESEQPFKTNVIEARKIKRFIEKPDIESAKQFCKQKTFTWNSGIFLFKAKTIVNEIRKYYPELLEICKEALKGNLLDLDFQRLDQNIFRKCNDISIDNAVMEKTDAGIVFPLYTSWSDIGSWKSVWEISNKDENGNVTKGKVLVKDSKDCLFRSESRLVVGVGLKDLVVIETDDAILVTKKDKSQEIKDLVKQLQEKKIPEGQNHKKIYRPWGNYTSIVEDERWQVKLISVKPGQKLSQQMHHHRSEHWVVVSGTAKVELDSKESILTENESSYIPLGSKHRLSNPGKIPLLLIEVQSGAYLGEDDIRRFDDNYGRVES